MTIVVGELHDAVQSVEVPHTLVWREQAVVDRSVRLAPDAGLLLHPTSATMTVNEAATLRMARPSIAPIDPLTTTMARGRTRDFARPATRFPARVDPAADDRDHSSSFSSASHARASASSV